MGVPKFYRWLAERYPLINQVVDDSLVKPEFDCLYLDMNGIVHNCTHDDDPLKKNDLSEDEMFAKIFRYIDDLFNLVKPRKLLFMAIDGVAPRAKMNQQRQRRFRSAQDLQDAVDEAKSKNLPIPDMAHRFDSNCITPGTEFMERLSLALRFFVRKKVKEDESWQSIRVIFSGAEVPGEGEHKIMKYIRQMKMQQDYDVNLRHCLYGLDADLVMLSLVSHEPHFSLLREEVVFGGGRDKSGARKALKRLGVFHLLHICCLREYIDLEFKNTALPFQYDVERIIDDWIFLGFLVGNDFLPHSATLDIAEGGLNTMYDIYRELLPSLGGYITHHGDANLDRFKKIVTRLGQLEDDIFQKRIDKKSKQNKRQQKIDASRLRRQLSDSQQMLMQQQQSKQIESDNPYAGLAENNNNSNDNQYDDEDVEEGEELPLKEQFDAQLQLAALQEQIELENDHRLNYYKEHFPEFFNNPDKTFEQCKQELCRAFFTGMIWTLKYYYQGTYSWKWYFPYFFAPLASDMAKLDLTEIKFDLGVPFTPLTQLMGVLPPASQRLVPECFRPLMLQDTSPILDFYPPRFEVNMNGKKNSWEGIAMIPFIDESRLLKALEPRVVQLKPSEVNRNSLRGVEYCFTFNPNVHDTVTSCVSFFRDIQNCQSVEQEWKLPDTPVVDRKRDDGLLPVHVSGNLDASLFYATQRGLFVPTVPQGTKIPAPGFPMLKSINVNGRLEKCNLNLFGYPSSKESLCLRVDSPLKMIHPRQLAERLIGNRVFVWPSLTEALVVSCCDGYTLWRHNQPEAKIEGRLQEDFHQHLRELAFDARGKKAVNTGDVRCVLGVRMFEGMKRAPDGSIRKSFEKKESEVIPQLCVLKRLADDPRHKETPAPTIEQGYPIGTPIVYIGPEFYGCQGKISSHGGNHTVGVDLEISFPTPDFGHPISKASRLSFFPAHHVSKSLDIHGAILSRLTSALFVEPGNVNIGLNLKSSAKSMVCADYVRLTQAWQDQGDARGQNSTHHKMHWAYSEQTIKILNLYKRSYPQLFEYLNRYPTADRIEVAHMLQGEDRSRQAQEAFVQEISDFLKSLGLQRLILVPASSIVMPARGALAVASESFRYHQLTADVKKASLSASNIPAHYLYTPTPLVPWSPTEKEAFQLGDRVMSLRSDEKVPFGYRGTVTAVYPESVEVVFDQEFMTGTHLAYRCPDRRGQLVYRTSVLNLSKPRLVRRKGQEGKVSIQTSNIQKGGRLPEYHPEIPVFVSSIQQAQADNIRKHSTNKNKHNHGKHNNNNNNSNSNKKVLVKQSIPEVQSQQRVEEAAALSKKPHVAVKKGWDKNTPAPSHGHVEPPTQKKAWDKQKKPQRQQQKQQPQQQQQQKKKPENKKTVLKKPQQQQHPAKPQAPTSKPVFSSSSSSSSSSARPTASAAAPPSVGNPFPQNSARAPPVGNPFAAQQQQQQQQQQQPQAVRKPKTKMSMLKNQLKKQASSESTQHQQPAPLALPDAPQPVPRVNQPKNSSNQQLTNMLSEVLKLDNNRSQSNKKK